MAARSVNHDGERWSQRAIWLVCVLVFMPTIGFCFEDVYKGVSSDQFEAFLNSKNISIPAATKSTGLNPTGTIANDPHPQPALPAVPAPNATMPTKETTELLGPVVLNPRSEAPVPSPPTTVAPSFSISEPVAAALPDTAVSQPPTASPRVATNTAQPGVELYEPPENNNLETLPWHGCWWEQPHALTKQLITRDSTRVQFADLEQLVWLSVQHSPAIQKVIRIPNIQRAEEDVARSEFDPRLNMRSNFRDTSDPVGNTLTTGGPNRLNEYFWENSVGITDRNTIGGKTELRQAMDARDSNSLFFIPGDQVDTKLSVNYTQPLRRGYGTFFNTSQIQIQQSKTQQEIATANEALQDHARQLHNAYWTLMESRFQFVQAVNTQFRLQDIHKMMSDRQGVDLIASQIKRVEKEIESLNKAIANLIAKIKSTQYEIAQLVAAPELQAERCSEIIPLTLPTTALPPSEQLIDEYYSALLYRGDLVRTRFRIEQTAIQKKVAIHELQSKLDLFLEGYVRGLEGDRQLFRSLTRQFDSGSPSYAAGLVYERPQGNRAAKANVYSNSESLAQLTYEYEDQLLKAYSQVNSAVERSKGSYQAIFASLNAAEAAMAEVELHQTRYDDYFSENASRSIILSEWLDAEMRLFNAERDLAEQQIEHMRNLTQIKFESGTLLTIEPVR